MSPLDLFDVRQGRALDGGEAALKRRANTPLGTTLTPSLKEVNLLRIGIEEGGGVQHRVSGGGGVLKQISIPEKKTESSFFKFTVLNF